MTADFDSLLREEINWAITQKLALSVQHQDDFRMRVKIVGPQGQVANTPVIWHDEDEKLRAMNAVSRTCRIVSAQAVMVTSDVRVLNVEAFCAHFNLAVPHSAAELKTFQKERWRVMEPYDYYMGNLPRPLWSELLMTFAYGPCVRKMLSLPYRVVDETFVFDEVKVDHEGLQIPMIPVWWV
jgi:hypothetical protein